MFIPLNLKNWIEEHRNLLKPPVGNSQIWEDREFMVTIVGGPNARRDFHINQGEEFFYQLEGAITLKIVKQGKFEDLAIREGEIYLLPARVPHSPQRPAGTVGMVIERKRLAGEKDGFVWFCDGCGTKLHEEFIFLKSIVRDLPPLFDRFYGDAALTTCKKCSRKHSR